MPHPLPALAAAIAVSLSGVAAHVASTHRVGAMPAARAAAVLPNNLCASCHGGRAASIRGAGALDARDLMAARSYLPDTPQG